MPTEEENVQYLYLVLTNGGPPSIDMAAVSKALKLSPGATSKRWSRLKKAMEDGKNPGPSAYELLWLCVKYNSKDKAMDWNAIATACGTTAGAASKRYSRMKQAFEKGDTPSKPKNTTADGVESPSKSADAGAELNPEATPTPKRKRAPAGSAKKIPIKPDPDQKFKPEPVSDDEDEHVQKKAKRARGGKAKPKATPKPPKSTPRTNVKSANNANKPDPSSLNLLPPTPMHTSSINPTEATTLIKSEDDIQAGLQEDFHDAMEAQSDADVDPEAEAENDESECQISECQLCECRGRWVANQVGLGVHNWLEEVGPEEV